MPRRIETRCEINAPIEKVWTVLTNVERYGDWNPFVYAVDCKGSALEKDTEMKLSVRWRDGGTVTSGERVESAEAPHAEVLHDSGSTVTVAKWVYCNSGLIPTLGMVNNVRVQELRQESKGAPTKYHSYGDFTGWACAFVPFSKVKEGFIDQGEALKTYVEENYSKEQRR